MRVPRSRWAVHVEAAVERLDAGRKAAQARAAGGVGAADAVVGHRHRRAAVRPGDATVACDACAYLATFVIASATT